jgi:D-aminoacyl-tRNA deacylase
MRAVIQRVSRASVKVDAEITGIIDKGLIVYLGVHCDDADSDCAYIAEKILNLRIFHDTEGKMNLSLLETGGDILVISQFTLYGDTRKGRRPSFNEAADPEKGKQFYDKFVEIIKKSGLKTATGIFGALMAVEYVNDGPVTILMDSFKAF